MPTATSSPDQACARCAGAEDWRADQIAILRELNDLNMRLARAVVARAEAAAEQAAEPDERPAAHARPDPSLALARLGRAVRLTLAMEARLRGDEADAGAAEHTPRRETDGQRVDGGDGARSSHITIKRWLVAEALQEAALCGDREAGDAPEREEVLGDIFERINGLSDDIIYDVPKSVLIDRLGAELDLAFDAETPEEKRDLQLWRGWELPPHEPEPPDEDAHEESALELSS